MDTPTNAVPVTKTRSWISWKNNQPWRYAIGFDREDRACFLDIRGGTQQGLALAWRTVDGEWLGRFRFDDGYVTARLSAIDIELIENTAKSVLS